MAIQTRCPCKPFSFILPDNTMVPAVRHKNPDGKLGGWVATGTAVPDSATIDYNAVVWPGVTIPPGAHISSGCVLTTQH